MSKEILDAVRALAAEKGISREKLMVALEDALLSAYKKTPGAAPYARVEMDRETGDFTVWELMIPEELEEQLLKEQEEEAEAAAADDEGEIANVDPETGEVREEVAPELDLEKLKEYEDQIERVDVTPDDFGRIAAQTAKQVILQRIREAERDMMFEEYRDRVGELITGIVQQSDSRYTLVQLRERVEALLPKSEQVDGERYDHSQRIKAVIKDVSASTKGPSIIVSRRDPELIKSLFELEVPEIADGLVEITNVAREPGYRSKIAVVSHADGVDPVGACVGPRGSRVRMVVSELRGEKIDIIPYNDEPARFVAKALSPARVREVLVDDEAKQATVIVPDDQLSLAIGREGQNARLAARLTGWRIDIRSETEFAHEEAEHGYEEEDGAGPLRRDPLQRPPLPERRAAGLALLRPRRAPGARRHRGRRGRRARRRRRRRRDGERRASRPRARGRGRRRRCRASRGRGAGREPRPSRRPSRRRARRERAGGSARRAAAGDDRRAARTRPHRPRATTALRRLRPHGAEARRCCAGSPSADAVVADPHARLPGRGAYTCRTRRCLERPRARGGFNRAFRRAVTAPLSRRERTLGRGHEQEARQRHRQRAGNVRQDLLLKLQAAGIDAAAPSATVDEALALRALGHERRRRERRRRELRERPRRRRRPETASDARLAAGRARPRRRPAGAAAS